MHYLKISIGVISVLLFTRLIPHPPNFTSLIALSFYIPALFGIKYIIIVLFAFFLSDLIIGFHQVLLFTWGSVVIIGLISKYFKNKIFKRALGVFFAAVIFFIISNFGVWLNGSYGYTLEGLIQCYTLALPFFKYSIISTILCSIIIEFSIKILKNTLKEYFIIKL